ncbi:MAG TPA: 3-oxoacid CoA-transferase subunit A, partial [Acidimicrobiia bacterium]|nr:3-oxoacid CoA-transferase subunit A [Acidimicrobiia bacterium]
MPIDKIVDTFDEAVADVVDGSVVHIGGFGGPAEYPSYLIAALARKGVTGLTITGNHSGFSAEQLAMMKERMATLLPYPDDYFSPGLLVERGQVAKGILAFPVLPGSALKVPFEGLLEEGKVELELIGQGSLAERIRAARAGIAAFYTPVGPGTVVAEGKEVRWFDGRPHLLEHALKGDVSIIRAHQADRWGNLVYRGTARTFNATMAGASHVTIAEVDEIVELGELDPECIVTPAPY